jgi:hypothetical protein
MWSRPLALPLLLCWVMACGASRREKVEEAPKVATDTVVRTKTVVDTTLVTIDTTVVTVDTTFKVDTTRVEGGRGEIVDTVK